MKSPLPASAASLKQFISPFPVACLAAGLFAFALAGSSRAAGSPPAFTLGGTAALTVGSAWGYNEFGQVGDGTTVHRHEYVAIPAVAGLTAVSSGGNFSYALMADGTVRAWGENNYGQLGNGTTTTPIPGLANVVKIAAGSIYGMALKADGTVWVWGNIGNLWAGAPNGQSATPLKVPGLSNVVSISSGQYHAIALKSDGTVWAWGSNSSGQLGSERPSSLSPVLVPSLSPTPSLFVTCIAAGKNHNLAVMSDGTVRAWGYNDSGQLGDNSTAIRHTPVIVTNSLGMPLSGVTAVAGGVRHSLARRSDGSVAAWGRNANGYYGDGTTIEQHTAIIVPNLDMVTRVEAGYKVSVYRRADGTLYGSGYNQFGGLGMAPVQTTVFTRVTSLTGALQHSLGDWHSQAVSVSPNAPVLTVPEDAGPQTNLNFAALTTAPNGPLAYTVTNSNPTLFSAQPAIAANGTLTFSSAPDAYGTAFVTVVATNAGGTSLMSAFTIIVTPQPEPPVLTLTGDANYAASNPPVLLDTGATLTDADSPVLNGGNVTVAYTSGGTATDQLTIVNQGNGAGQLGVAAGVVSFGGNVIGTFPASGFGSGVNGATLVVTLTTANATPAALQALLRRLAFANSSASPDGTDRVLALSVTDSTASTGLAAKTVHVLNVPPVITVPPAGATVFAGTPVTFTVTVTGTPPLNYEWRRGAVVVQSGASASLSLSPARVADEGDYTVVVSNGAGSVASAPSAVLTVLLNTAPDFTKGADLIVNEDAGPQTHSAWATAITKGSQAFESGQTLTFNLTGNTAPTLFSAGPVIAANGTLTFTPAAQASGSATLTVTLSDTDGTVDGGGDTSAAQTFTITVNSVNDAPVVALAVNNLVVAEDVGTVTSNAFAVVTSLGAPNEAGQTISHTLSHNNNSLFIVAPAINPDGVLTFTPATNANGSATVTVVSQDSGGTDNGGVDKTTNIFLITVTAVNDAPDFTLSTASHFASSVLGAQTVADFLTGISPGPANEAGQTVAFTVSSSAPSLFTVPPAIAANGTLTFTPVHGVLGAATVTVIAVDTGGTANGGVDRATNSFTLSLAPGNVAPSFALAATNVTVLHDSAAQTVAHFVTNIIAGPANEAGQLVNFAVANDNHALFTVDGQPAVDASGTLTYTPAGGAFGLATVTVIASDDGGIADGGMSNSVPQTFALIVASTMIYVDSTPDGQRGETVVVPVKINALGTEGGVSFTLTFDATHFTYDTTALGAGVPGGVLALNTNQVGTGKLGVLVAQAPLDPAVAFAAGVSEIVNVTFMRGAPVTGSPVGFSSAVVLKQVVQPDSTVMPYLLYQAGTVTTTAIPAYEGDVSPRPTGNGSVTVADLVQIGRFITGLDTAADGSEFQRADSAPRATGGDGLITLADYVQAARYATGVDPLTAASGPTTGNNGASLLAARSTARGSLRLAGTRALQLASAAGQAGQIIVLPVTLTAQGNENSLGFSLGYNPAQLQFIGLAAGGGAAGATVIANPLQAAAGRVGMILALPAGATFGAGPREVARATFRVAPGGAGGAAVSFGDAPVFREVVDANANALAADHLAAAITVLGGSPMLRAQAQGHHGADGQQLMLGSPDGGQMSPERLARMEVWIAPSLMAPAGQWTLLPNALVLINGQIQLRDAGAANAAGRFYKVLER